MRAAWSGPTEHDARYERLTPDDLGLAPSSTLPLRFRPAEQWSPLVISFPHVGLRWPAHIRPKPQVDLRRNADYEVHRLYDRAAALGAACVHAVYSRLVVDLNRAADDVSPAIVPDHPAPRPRKIPGVLADDEPTSTSLRPDRPGRGVVWASAIGNVRILREPLTFAAFRERIERYHAPYYRAIEVLLLRRVARFGFAVLLDAHSMPGSVGPDVVLGTLGWSSCAPSLQTLALQALDPERRDAADDSEPSDASATDRLDVRLNEPYRGGELVRRFGRPEAGMHALQLEVSRGLYMDEGSHVLLPMPLASAGPRSSPELRPAGTSGALVRDGHIDASIAAPTPGLRPSPRQARDLAGLVDRVTCLISSLAGLGGESDTSIELNRSLGDPTHRHDDAH